MGVTGVVVRFARGPRLSLILADHLRGGQLRSDRNSLCVPFNIW